MDKRTVIWYLRPAHAMPVGAVRGRVEINEEVRSLILGVMYAGEGFPGDSKTKSNKINQGSPGFPKHKTKTRNYPRTSKKNIIK